MSEEEEVVVIPPKKKTNKLRRWLDTSTAKGAIAFAAAGLSVVVSPDVGQAVTQAADGISKGDVAGITAAVIAGALGFLRARSA